MFQAQATLLVEAMLYGLPVLASDIPVFREIGAGYPRYFDHHDKGALGEMILQFESAGPRPGNRIPGQWLSWSDSARMLLEKVTAAPTAFWAG